VETHASPPEFLERRRPGTPGCVLADLQMPGFDGLELQAALAASTDPLPVVFLTAHGDIPTSVKAMKQGAEDFLVKHAPKEELIAAVRRALERNTAERAERMRRSDLRERIELLTPREREVLLLVIQGLPNKEIASTLAIHERTVKLHRTGLTRKLGVHSVAELVHLTREAGILPVGAVAKGPGLS
jgi:FixJ family two-component response regulator